MTLKEAIELGRRAITHATYRDVASGGGVRIYHVHNNGWTKICENVDVNKLHYEDSLERGLDG